MDRSALSRRVREIAADCGFSSVGIAAPGPIAPDRLVAWLSHGYQGSMAYLECNSERRLDPSRIMSDVGSVVSLALDYRDPEWAPDYENPRRGSVSRYALGRDYHRILEKKLKSFMEGLTAVEPNVKGRWYVDTGPVLEKVWGARAGIGWIGKHTNLISRRRGSWFFLAEVFLNLDLEPDTPVSDFCGSCTRCIDACPTRAIVEPYVLDARRCISYLTIELREEIPVELRPAMGNLVFGCDICQEVCPWNEKADPSGDPDFHDVGRDYSLESLSRLTPEAFARVFQGSAVKRSKWRGFMRNVAIAMGNSGRSEFIPHLRRLVECGDELVAGHALWALEQLEFVASDPK